MDDVRDTLHDTPVTQDAAPAPTQDSDRRRPGRLSAVPPALLPLLRRQTLLSDTASGPADGADDTDGAKMFFGLVVGALMATPFWLLVGIILWWALR